MATEKTTTTDAHWHQVKDVLDVLLELPHPPDAGEICRLCGGDKELVREVSAFVEVQDGLAGFMETPLVAPYPPVRREGRRIGPYRLQQLIGRGGMGEVYLAVREDEYEQQVALKLLHDGVDQEGFARRLRRERQVLARLEHPNIARLLDGGTTEMGLPYLVMDYVEGERLDHFCDRGHLGLDDRLELFLQVCAAVQEAHRNLVVHRDLKPGNVLVTADGVPKLLDFGIAKPLHAGEDSTEFYATPSVDRIVTTRFASPEQLRDEPVTTATDVYGLGALLYHLLTGRAPYHREAGRDLDLLMAICDKDPIPPSRVVQLSEDDVGADGCPIPLTPRSVSRLRRTSPGRLHRRLSGDLDSIVARAMRKKPEERYGSADALAEDVRRHLAGLAVRTRGDSWLYRAGKLVWHRRWTTAALVLLLVVTVGLAVLWRRAVAEQARAEESEQAHAVALYDLGLLFLEQGSPDQAEGALERAWEIRRRVFGEGHLQVAAVLAALARVHHVRGELDEAEARLRRALDIRCETLGPDHPEVERTRDELDALTEASAPGTGQ